MGRILLLMVGSLCSESVTELGWWRVRGLAAGPFELLGWDGTDRCCRCQCSELIDELTYYDSISKRLRRLPRISKVRVCRVIRRTFMVLKACNLFRGCTELSLSR